MQAFEIETEIDSNGEIHIRLPLPRQAGPARVIVLLDTDQASQAEPQRHQQSPRLAGQAAWLHGDDIAPASSPDTETSNDFAGIWGEMPEEDFRDFLSEIDERRRSAFASRPRR